MSATARTAIVIVIILVIGLAYWGFSLTRDGFSSKEQPSGIEEFLARNLRRLATPAQAKELKNPYLPTPELIESVREHWAEHCALCHGVDGSGNTLIGQNLYPKATDLRNPSVQSLSDGEIFYIISNGIRFTGMPAWSETDSPEEIWQFVSLIRKLPTLTPAELELLKQNTSEPSAATQEMKDSQHTH